MANGNAARGLVPLRYKNGAPYNGAATRYYVGTGVATNLFVGDPVLVSGDGDAAGTPGVVLATAGATNYITGAIVGIESLTPSAILTNYHPASTAGYILVADDPNLVFAVQEDSDVSNIAAADISGNVDLVSGTGSTYTGQSGWMLNSNTVGTGATLQARILGLLQAPDNAIGTYGKWLIEINLHSQRNLTGV